MPTYSIFFQNCVFFLPWIRPSMDMAFHGHGLTWILTWTWPSMSIGGAQRYKCRLKSCIKRYQVFHNCFNRGNIRKKKLESLVQVFYLLVVVFLFLFLFPFSGSFLRGQGSAEEHREQLRSDAPKGCGRCSTHSLQWLCGIMVRKQPIGWLFLSPANTPWDSHHPISATCMLGTTLPKQSKYLTDKNRKSHKSENNINISFFYPFLYFSILIWK